MVRSSNVPRELWILRVVLSKFVEYVFGLPVLAVFAVAYAVAPTKYLYLIPLGWVLEAVLVIGIGLILAPCTVLFNDLERIVPIVVRVLFYASPMLYSVSNVPGAAARGLLRQPHLRLPHHRARHLLPGGHPADRHHAGRGARDGAQRARRLQQGPARHPRRRHRLRRPHREPHGDALELDLALRRRLRSSSS